ncbi:Transcription termination factor 1 [Oryzias melastigma]|uniref:Transcription termination factor 1 n=1 Tax=Oryzias melastigma TaxID=30732 RepID=A0A834CDW3_ORYME|nr:Transcription termination factor 1 [Oryzias melastigma]
MESERSHWKERAAAKPTKRGKSLSRNKTVSSMNELDLDLVGQLEEFVPDVRNKSAPEIMKLLRYDLHRFRDFKQKGVPLRSGRFTVPENHQIEQNMADFIALTNMGSAEQVLFPQRFKEQAPKIRKLKILHCFFEKIAEGIPRPCHQVYTRAKKIFDIRNHMGRFSEDELHSLQKLHQLHGNDWKAMSDKMDRSVYALQKRFLLHTARGARTKSPGLKQAIRDHLETVFQESLGSGLTMDQLCSNLPWQKISQKVETRHWNQCRLKWFNLLNKITKGKLPRGPEGYKAKILLINTLFSMSVDDLADIEWDEVACAVGNVTPMCVQRMFHRLKVTKVPNWSRMSYGDIITFLKDHVVPALQEKLSSCSSTPDSQEPQEEVKYQLSQILSTDNDLEVDNT